MPKSDLEPSPAELGDTMTVAPGEWAPLDDIGTQIYVYGDQPVDIAVQTAAVDDEVRRLRATVGEIARRLDEYRGAKALRDGIRAIVDRARGAVQDQDALGRRQLERADEMELTRGEMRQVLAVFSGSSPDGLECALDIIAREREI